MRIAVSVMMALIISSCVSIPTILPMSVHNLGTKPEKELITTVELGNPIYSEYDYTTNPVARISDSFIYKEIVYQTGKEYNGMMIDGIETYCGSELSYGATHPCLSDSNRDGNFDEVMDLSSIANSWAVLKEPVPYRLLTGRYNEGKGFRLELLYQGVSDNNILVSYREYRDNMARPAFTQDVKYQLDKKGKTIIGFKGARLEVIKATNIELTYRVIKGFDI